MKRPHLVVLSVSAGAGHVRAAAAVCAQAEAAGLRATHIDIMQRVPPWFRWLYADMYAALVKRAPLLWAWLYRAMNCAGQAGPLQRLRRVLERHFSARWLADVAALSPDAILCTHFLPAEVLSRRADAKPRIDCPLFVHITDFDVHAMWLQPEPSVAGYFAGNAEVAFQLLQAGVAEQRVVVSGLAVMPAFRAIAPSPGLLAEYGFIYSRPTVLLMGGGGGVGALDAIAAQLLDAAGGFQLLVLAGRNRAALAALTAMAPAWPGRLAALGFTDQVAPLMAACDIVITKPGGLTTAECLAVGVAVIVNAPIPGQEERNADYLLEHGAALKAVDAATLAWRLRCLLDDPARRRTMAQHARALGRPDAARHICDSIHSHLQGVSRC